LCDLGATEFGALLLARMAGQRFSGGTRVPILAF